MNIRMVLQWVVLSLVFLPVVSGCSYMRAAQVPALKNNNDILDEAPIPLSTVMTALKHQLGQAFAAIQGIKERYADSPAVQGLEPQEGTALLTGTVQTIASDAGNIAAIIAFTGYTGSNISPNFGASRSATGLQAIALKFSVKPNKTLDRVIDNQGLDTGTYIIDALTATFEQLASAPYNKADRKGYQPAFTNRELSLSISFSVVRVVSGGFGIKIVPSGPDVESVTTAPAIGMNDQKLATYKLDLTIPLITPQPDDPRRVVSGLIKGDRILLVDEPYSRDRLCGLAGIQGLVVTDVKKEPDGSVEIVDVCDSRNVPAPRDANNPANTSQLFHSLDQNRKNRVLRSYGAPQAAPDPNRGDGGSFIDATPEYEY